MLLLGTTDTPYEGDPDELRATEEDVRTVLAEAAVALGPEAVEAGPVRSTSAGLRVLPAARGPTSRARRETVLLHGRAGMLTVAGGKLTTYRRIALAALSALRSELGLSRVGAEPAPLPGAVPFTEALARLTAGYPELNPRVRSHLAHLYGGRAADVVRLADGRAELLEPLDPTAAEIAAQAVYAREHEWACTADDVLRRRTTLAARGLDGPEVVARVDALLKARADVP
jgi:glycerol-3-phosphate dehydrogenase